MTWDNEMKDTMLFEKRGNIESNSMILSSGLNQDNKETVGWNFTEPRILHFEYLIPGNVRVDIPHCFELICLRHIFQILNFYYLFLVKI